MMSCRCSDDSVGTPFHRVIGRRAKVTVMDRIELGNMKHEVDSVGNRKS